MLENRNKLTYSYLVYAIDKFSKFFSLHSGIVSATTESTVTRDTHRYTYNTQVEFDFNTKTQNSHFIHSLFSWQSNHSSKPTHFRRHLKQKKIGLLLKSKFKNKSEESCYFFSFYFMLNASLKIVWARYRNFQFKSNNKHLRDDIIVKACVRFAPLYSNHLSPRVEYHTNVEV